MMKLLLRCVWFGVMLYAALICAPGCSSREGGAVTFDALDQNRTLTQVFPHAYIGQAGGGEYDVILVDKATDWDYRSPGKNRPLQPGDVEPIRQMMRIHLYWRPLAGTTRNPAATNASVDWYVMGPDGSGDMVVYEGAGFVMLRGSGDELTVVIRDGTVSPASGRGSLRDPVGPAKISGEAVAKVNSARVRETISEILKQAGVARK